MFHYTNEKGLYGLLSSKRLWLVSSGEMEDITDRFYANMFVTIALLRTDDEDVKKIRENLDAKDIIQANMEALEIPFYSASFCMDSKNECLWEKYADRRKGVCIEFNEDYFYEYKLTAILRPVRKAVVLCLDDDILQGAGLYDLGKHTVKSAFLFDVTHQNSHPTAFFQCRKLFHHGIIHCFDEIVPVFNTGQVQAFRVISVLLHHIGRFVHDIGILNDGNR